MKNRLPSVKNRYGSKSKCTELEPTWAQNHLRLLLVTRNVLVTEHGTPEQTQRAVHVATGACCALPRNAHRTHTKGQEVVEVSSSSVRGVELSG